ncbi:MAG TPA: response regulator transcription factor [Noviherbaspirillum sp.]
MRLLLIEDDAMIGDDLHEGLRGEGYAVDWVRDGRSAELALGSHAYDLVLLDLGLPKKSGTDILAAYRHRGGVAPVMIITARDATADRVLGLDTGADDYLVKPFDLDELFARIRALLRRRAGRTRAELVHGNLVVNVATREATLDGKAVHLSSREFSILHVLLDAAGAVVSKTQLEEKLYGWQDEVESNAVDVHIHHLRKKLGAELIRNVRGVGYRIPSVP